MLELIAGFLAEGVPQGALVNGMITGITGLIWIILLWRFVFSGGEEEDAVDEAVVEAALG